VRSTIASQSLGDQKIFAPALQFTSRRRSISDGAEVVVSNRLRKDRLVRLTKVLVVLALCSTPFSLFAQSFVQRSGTHLTLDGKPFRFSGPNIEWLGLSGYGPHDPVGPRYATHAEIDDVFATADEMGARVVRSQTMGDTVGCGMCIEP
jgi:hypothetical protein